MLLASVKGTNLLLSWLSPLSKLDFAPNHDNFCLYQTPLRLVTLGFSPLWHQTLVLSDELSVWSFAPRHCLHEDLFIRFVVFQLHADKVSALHIYELILNVT